MYFLGDTHDVRTVIEVLDKKKIEDTSVIHVGDFGLGFQRIDRDIANLTELDEFCQEKNIEFYVIRGNHDNPIFWRKELGLRLPKMFNVHLVDDYSILRIEKKTLLCIGGAISIDRLIRASEPEPTWWSGETFVHNPERLKFAAESVDNIDIVVTHTAPDFAYPRGTHAPIVQHYADIEKKHGFDLISNLETERKTMKSMWKDLVDYGMKPTHWIYGHFHNTKKEIISGIEFKLLNINELYEL